ncbi:hypothetical protein [uncultured Akkermansia sp.]|uniref:hypothetical protein n=2 Tax=uncultured Akkermansia sp. TaxID=512294 RepID=UPI0027D97CF3|nr:hypothetical protein [uncultured Akkermansia sp.]
MLESLFNVMNTKQSYPVTDSITNVVEAGIITATVVSLIACEVTRHMGHALEGGVYKGVKSSWGLVKGARQRLVTYRERISEKVSKARSEEVVESAVTDEEISESQTLHHDTVPAAPSVQPHVEEAPAPAGMPTPALA